MKKTHQFLVKRADRDESSGESYRRVAEHPKDTPADVISESAKRVTGEGIVQKKSLRMGVCSACLLYLSASWADQNDFPKDPFAPLLKEVETSPLQTVFIPIRHANADEISELLRNRETGLMSERGNILVDKRTNQLWIRDRATHLKEIQSFLKGIDVPAQQVHISARIVNIDEVSAQSLGLKFGSLEDPGAPLVEEKGQKKAPLKIHRMGHINLAIAKLSQSMLLDLELSALEKEGRAHTLSNPQLMTTNRESALIEAGQEIPYQESAASGATSVSFKKAALSLQVTPEVRVGHKIFLKVAVHQDKVDSLTINGVPAISTQQIQSQVLLNHGETVVLGGIYEEDNSHAEEKIPYWKKVPILGHLVSHHERQAQRRQLLVFITPRIMGE